MGLLVDKDQCSTAHDSLILLLSPYIGDLATG